MSNINALLLEVAKLHLKVDTLETRNSDRLDFQDCHVANLKRALLNAYTLGIENGYKDGYENGQSDAAIATTNFLYPREDASKG